jgi:tripartite-type tricarboxylate transporter receptor subunit TctC
MATTIGPARRFHACMATVLAACAVSHAAAQPAATGAAQGYPNRPVRLIMPYPAGSSSNDIMGRALAIRLSEQLGQQIVFDNRAGASGTLGTEMVAKAQPDGYTLLLGINGPLAISPSVYPKLGYDTLRDFAPVAMVALVPYIIVVNPTVPAQNIKEFIALAKAQPGKLHFASSGSGGTPHLCGELLKTMAGIDLVHVPYKGGAPAIVDTVAGQTQMFCPGVTGALQFVKQGKLRALGLTTLKRSPLLPDLPTLHEQGLTGFDASSWMAIVAPAKTPRPIVQRLSDEIARALNHPEFRNFILQQGSEPTVMNPEELRAYIRTEIDKWAKVVKLIGLKVD